MYMHNRAVNDFTQKVSVVDSLECFEEFHNVIESFKSYYSKGIFSVKTAYSESLLYGHVQALLSYAGLPQKDKFYVPLMEHGIQFGEVIPGYNFSRIFQGEYLFDKWKKAHPGVPLFAVGPYIHYAQPYYDIELTDKIKQRNGKTLTIFPTHTYELSFCEYNSKAMVDHVMSEVARGFDTVMVCCYWADLDNDVYKFFKEAGAILVSAGFRSDTNFIRRLKTIIELSDSIWGNDLGTFVGYASYLNKPTVLVQSSLDRECLDINYEGENWNCLKKAQDVFSRVYAPDKPYLSNEQYALCEPFWGFGKVRTPEEIRAIVSINKNIIMGALGNDALISRLAAKYLKSKRITDLEYRLLEEALAPATKGETK